MARETSTNDVFINCPFDAQYSKIFDALIFAIFASGFRPRSAREIDDNGEVRIEKLYRLISQCRYGIHDICRTQLDRENNLPRFNMPLELGIFLGAKRFGDKVQKQKCLLIFDKDKFRYQKFISDLAGMDIHSHSQQPLRVISETRNWLANMSEREVPGDKRILKAYKKFSDQLPTLKKKVGLPKKVQYVDYERLVVGFLSPEKKS